MNQTSSEDYGRGVAAGKLEALKYTPEEREAYGKHVAESDYYTKLRRERDAALARVAELEKRCEGHCLICHELISKCNCISLGRVQVDLETGEVTPISASIASADATGREEG